jgi:hypothetical protein
LLLQLEQEVRHRKGPSLRTPRAPFQVPVPSTVTCVRSIQSSFVAQPDSSVVAMRSVIRRFIAACGRVRSGRAALGSGPWEPSFQAGRSLAVVGRGRAGMVAFGLRIVDPHVAADTPSHVEWRVDTF